MNPVPISRRGLVVDTGAVLGAFPLPADVSRPWRRGRHPQVSPALAVVFDPQAFVNDLLAMDHRMAIHQPVRVTFDADEDLRPSFCVYPEPGSGFNRAYREVMARWASQLDATPDHVDEVVHYAPGHSAILAS